MNRCSLFFLLALLHWQTANGQLPKSAVHSFFENDSILPAHLQADFAELRKNREKDIYRKAAISIFIDGVAYNNIPVETKPRGVFRKDICNPPQLMINFKGDKTSPLYKLGRLKLVHACSGDALSDQLIIKEYLVYKLYQQFTSLSFRVRLVQLEMSSPDGVLFSKARYAFFLEDVDDMAKRNDYKELDETTRETESLNRNSNTVLALFQFMIGNTDWSIPLNKNVKIIQQKGHNELAPVAVPYDFDYCGLVDAPYATPFDGLPILSVTERLYRGYGRMMEELETAIQLFVQKKMVMYNLVNACSYLTIESKRDMIKYLDSFFELVVNENKVKDLFIRNAREK